MKNKKLIIGLVAVAAVIGIILIARPQILKRPAAKKAPPVAARELPKKAATLPSKKVFAKGKGGLTVKLLDSKKKEVIVRVRAFKSIDSRSSLYQASLISNRQQELSQGTYDLELDTLPQRIYKNVRVVAGKENIEDLGCLTGSINVKAIDENKKEVRLIVRILKSDTNELVTTASANRSIEILPGVYNIELTSIPKQERRGIRINAGEEVNVEFSVQAPPQPAPAPPPEKPKK